MLETVLAIGYLLGLAIMFVGLILCSKRIRTAIVDVYVAASLDRVTGRSVSHICDLAEAMCRVLYIGKNDLPSAGKTFAVGSIAGLFVGVPVALFLMIAVRGSSGTDWSAPPSRVLVWHLLPLTILVHWASEYLLASVLWSAVKERPRLAIVWLFVRVGAALLVASTAPYLFSLLAFRFQDQIPQGLTFAWGLLLNGPSVLLSYLSLQIRPEGAIFWLAAASTMTFATAILILALATLLVRFRPGYTALTALIGLMGRASGPTLIGIGVGLFGFCTNFPSFWALMKKLLGQ